MTIEETYEYNHPQIPWRQAIPLQVEGHTIQWLACRFCIAIHGLHAAEAATCGFCFLDQLGFDEHMKTAHALRLT